MNSAVHRYISTPLLHPYIYPLLYEDLALYIFSTKLRMQDKSNHTYMIKTLTQLMVAFYA